MVKSTILTTAGKPWRQITTSIFFVIVILSYIHLSQIFYHNYDRPGYVNNAQSQSDFKVPMPSDDSTDSSNDDTDGISPPREKLNVLILYPDDWRHDMMSSANPALKTPFLDSLAKEGIRFTQNCVTTSICWHSRATLFTGQYSSRHQSTKLKCPHFSWNYEKWKATWPHLLQKVGYWVGHIGKWQYHDYPKNRHGYFNHSNYFQEGYWIEKKHSLDIAEESTLAFLRDDGRPKDKPFALTVAFFPPKALGVSNEPGEQFMPKKDDLSLFENETIAEPYDTGDSFSRLPHFLQDQETRAREKFIERYGTSLHYQKSMKNIYALIKGLDTAMENIVLELKQQGIYNNTMIIVSADNGMFHSEHGLAGKWYPYQESIRVPLIIRDPRMPSDKVGTTNDAFTLNVDLASTILGAAGLSSHPTMQGRDISDLYLPKIIKGKTALEREKWRDEFYYEFPAFDYLIPSSTALVRKKWKYIRWPEPRHSLEQLFNLEHDPLELNDLRNSSTQVLADMRKRHNELEIIIKDPIGEKLECTEIIAQFPKE